MGAKHTPGPWHVFDASAAQQLIVNEATTIAKTMCGNDRANARLIATAPEFMALAQMILDNIIISGTYIGVEARRLIAKATGEQP